MKTLIALSFSLLAASSNLALAGPTLFAAGEDNGGGRFIGTEMKAVTNAVDQIKAICSLRGTMVSGVNVHFSSCSWGRSGEVKECKALVTAACNDGQPEGRVLAISQSAQTKDSGDMDQAEANAGIEAKKRATEKCAALNGVVASSVEAALCEGPNNTDDLTCEAASVVACSY